MLADRSGLIVNTLCLIENWKNQPAGTYRRMLKK